MKEWFDDLTMEYDQHEDPTLTGLVARQAGLHGLQTECVMRACR